MAPDVNVLLASAREDHPQHRVARSWLSQALQNHDALGGVQVLPMVASGFLRIATNPKAFSQPMPVKEAVEFLDNLLTRPGVEMPAVGRAEWNACQVLCRAKNIRGGDVTDAFIAASVNEAGGHLVTFDRDFLSLLPKSALTVLNPESKYVD